MSQKKMFVSNKDESARIFKSGFFELFSKVHFSIPLFIFIPVLAYCGYYAINYTEIGILFFCGVFLLGLAFWTIAEYCIHRFVFHLHPTTDFMRRVHFVFHGIHHDYPNDSLRLVMPPVVSIPMSSLFLLLFIQIFPLHWVAPFFAGFILGYLCYDLMHYAIHHVNSKSKLWNKIRSHHLKHHYQDDNLGYGVSSPIWDVIFSTNFKK